MRARAQWARAQWGIREKGWAPGVDIASVSGVEGGNVPVTVRRMEGPRWEGEGETRRGAGKEGAIYPLLTV